MTREGLLATVVQEEEDRRSASIHEIETLHYITKRAISVSGYSEMPAFDIEDLKVQVLKNLDYDIASLTKLMNYLKENLMNQLTEPLKTNKNLLLFECAKNIISNNITIFTGNLNDTFKMDPSKITVLGGNDGDIKGTSMPNCLQTAMLTIMYTLSKTNDIHNIFILNLHKIYQVDTSANIQTTMFPPSFRMEAIFPELVDWFYYYKDQKSPAQGELLIPTLGYAFGGSRSDLRYKDKIFKNEDCSSSLAKWTKAEFPFSTMHMKQAYDGNCGNDNYCQAVLNVMSPLSDDLVASGDIFAFRTKSGGHTGIVTKRYIKEEKTCYETLSYSKDMLVKEGLGYTQDCPHEYPNRTYMFFTSDTNDNATIPHYDEL